MLSMRRFIGKVLAMFLRYMFGALVVGTFAVLLIGPQYIRWRVNSALDSTARIGFIAARYKAGWLFREYRRNWPKSKLPTFAQAIKMTKPTAPTSRRSSGRLLPTTDS